MYVCVCVASHNSPCLVKIFSSFFQQFVSFNLISNLCRFSPSIARKMQTIFTIFPMAGKSWKPLRNNILHCFFSSILFSAPLLDIFFPLYFCCNCSILLHLLLHNLASMAIICCWIVPDFYKFTIHVCEIKNKANFSRFARFLFWRTANKWTFLGAILTATYLSTYLRPLHFQLF